MYASWLSKLHSCITSQIQNKSFLVFSITLKVTNWAQLSWHFYLCYDLWFCQQCLENKPSLMMNVWVLTALTDIPTVATDKRLSVTRGPHWFENESVKYSEMRIEIVFFLCCVSSCLAGALNLYLRAFPDHIVATQNEVFERNCIGRVEDLFHPKWVFTRDDFNQANLQDCKWFSYLSQFCWRIHCFSDSGSHSVSWYFRF